MAVSPDIQQQFQSQGIKLGDKVELKLSDGSTVARRYDDHTASDQEAQKLGLKPLRGRFDLRSVSGAHQKTGVAVLGFQKLQEG
jgi:hypothetical protein